MNNIRNIIRDNHDFVAVIGFVIGGVIIFLLIIVNYLSGVDKSYKDSVSGEDVSMVETGGISNVMILGSDLLIKDGLNEDVFFDARNKMAIFFQEVFPKITSLSYKEGDFVKNDDGKIYFTLTSNKKDVFEFMIRGENKYTYEMTIIYQGEQILSYDASKIIVPNKNPNKLKEILPYTINLPDNPPVTVVTYGRTESVRKYEIAVDSCGDEKIKEQAIKIVHEWLMSQWFNPEDFTFSVPNYCDGAGA